MNEGHTHTTTARYIRRPPSLHWLSNIGDIVDIADRTYQFYWVGFPHWVGLFRWVGFVHWVGLGLGGFVVWVGFVLVGFGHWVD